MFTVKPRLIPLVQNDHYFDVPKVICLVFMHNKTHYTFFRISKLFQNPPEQDLKASGTSLTERKEKRSKRREQEHQNEEGSAGNGENGGGNGNGNHIEEDYGDDDDAEWTTDVSKEAVKKRMKVRTRG